jgi:transcriptional regulator with GAF, ATPase, and Fis domain
MTAVVPACPPQGRSGVRSWPGHRTVGHSRRTYVRELENVIERAVILSRSGGATLDVVLPRANGDTRPPASQVSPVPLPDEIVPDVEWRRRQRANIVAALQRAGGRIYG